jgi:uncharacterized protein (TIGR02246 family)
MVDVAAAADARAMTAIPTNQPGDLNAAIAAAFRSGDVDAFLALHEPDATVAPPPSGEPVTGLDAIRAAVLPVIGQRPAMTSTPLRVVQGGNGLAVTHARWTMGDGTFHRGTIVSRRQPDGTWRIVLDDPLTPA